MDGNPRPHRRRSHKAGDSNGGNPEQAGAVRPDAPGSQPEGWPPRWITPTAQADLERSLGPLVSDFAEDLIPIAKDSIAGLSGEPLYLRGWQRELLRHMLARKEDLSFAHRFFMVGMGRKNGKTALASVLPIYFGLFGDRGGEIYGAAADREQAKLIMSHARRAVELTPELQDKVRIYRDALEFKGTGTTYRALSSESFTKEGLSATLILADELAAWPNRELFDVLSLSMGARRSPLFVAITTAGQRVDSTGMDSIAYTLYQLARRRIAGENDDATLGMAWWEAGEGAYADESRWGEANPGLLSEPPILSIEDLRSAKKRTPEGEFMVKRLNTFQASGTAFLPAGTWDACADPSLVLDPSDQIVLGFDGSFSSDSTGIVAARLDDGALFVMGHWERPIDDLSWRVPIDEVEDRMMEICRTYAVVRICADPFRWQRSMQVWESQGLPITEFPQNPTRMVPATAALYDAVVNGRLKHDGHPSLARHVANATPYTTRHGVMIRKGKDAGKKIDLVVCSIMAYASAMSMATGDAPKPQASVQWVEL